jgi:hypothetical protein
MSIIEGSQLEMSRPKIGVVSKHPILGYDRFFRAPSQIIRFAEKNFIDGMRVKA